jgi:hypothetical protein
LKLALEQLGIMKIAVSIQTDLVLIKETKVATVVGTKGELTQTNEVK